MVFTLLVSTLSFTFIKHFCGSTPIATAIFAKTKTCCDTDLLAKQKKIPECSLTKKDCCSDKIVVVHGQDNLKHSVDNSFFKQQVFITSSVYIYANLLIKLRSEVIPFKHYTPPQLIKNLHLLDEVFLI